MPRAGAPTETPESDRRQAQRRRRQLIERRRRDLLEDLGAGLVLAIVVLSMTAGLGVVVLLAMPTALALVASLIVERRRRRPPRPHRTRRTSNRAGRPTASAASRY